jgi:hypothetical protein
MRGLILGMMAVSLAWAADGDPPPPDPDEDLLRRLPPAARVLNRLLQDVVVADPLLEAVNAVPLPWPIDPKAPRAGRETSVAAAPPAVYRFVWDDYNTILAIGEGAGRIRPAWVVTMSGVGGQVAVAYRGNAFRDGGGRIHVDARRVDLGGPMAGQWSPDSFCISGAWVHTLDDADRGHVAPLAQTVLPEQNPTEYRRLLHWSQAVVEGGS